MVHKLDEQLKQARERNRQRLGKVAAIKRALDPVARLTTQEKGLDLGRPLPVFYLGLQEAITAVSSGEISLRRPVWGKMYALPYYPFARLNQLVTLAEAVKYRDVVVDRGPWLYADDPLWKQSRTRDGWIFLSARDAPIASRRLRGVLIRSERLRGTSYWLLTIKI